MRFAPSAGARVASPDDPADATQSRKGAPDAPVPHPLQLYPCDLGEAHRASRRPPERRNPIHRGCRRQTARLLVCLRRARRLHPYEAPDNVAMAANSIAIGAGGALSSLETVVLLSVDETLDALERARAITYRSPGSGTG